MSVQSPFDEFVAPARAYPQIWRLILGILFGGAVFMLGVLFLLGIIWVIVGSAGAVLWFERMEAAETPTSALLLLVSFSALALGAFAAARVFHKRGPASLFGPGALVVRDFTISAITVGLIYGLSIVVWSQSFDAVLNLDFRLWLSFLPLALCGLLIQTGAEELAFRGYLQQQLAARFGSPLAWLLLPSLIFGLVHFDPSSAGANAWLMAAAATLFGLVAADLTARTGGIGAAWGFHFANNCIAVLFLATKDTITGLSLYLTPYSANDPSLPTSLILADFALVIVAWLACRRLLRR